MTKLKECKSCSKEVAKSAKKCPHCGAKLKAGFMTKVFAGIAVLIVLGIIFKPSPEEVQKELDTIANSQASNLSPSGELGAIFKLDSQYTDIQRDNKLKEIKGKIVDWKLKVYEINKRGDGYRVQTQGNDAIFDSTTPIVSTFISVIPRSDQDKLYLESLKTGDTIRVKGKLSGDTTLRNLEIEPAIVLR